LWACAVARSDGAGLLCGILKSLVERGPECPKVLVATHFHEVFRREILDPELAPITFMHMQVMFASDRGGEGHVGTQDGKGPDGRITYLYRSVHDVLLFRHVPQDQWCFSATAGLSFASHAAKCMRIYGIPPKLVERAEHISYVLDRLISSISSMTLCFLGEVGI
jgi:DNA mismatch repair protein MSH5